MLKYKKLNKNNITSDTIRPLKKGKLIDIRPSSGLNKRDLWCWMRGLSLPVREDEGGLYYL